MKLKRISAFLLAAMFAVSTVACGDSDESSKKSKKDSSSAAEVTSSTAESTADSSLNGAEESSEQADSVDDNSASAYDSDSDSSVSDSASKAVKNADGLYEYTIAGGHTVTCRTNIYDYLFVPEWYDGSKNNFVDMINLSRSIGFEPGKSVMTNEIVPEATMGFRYYENGEEKAHIAFDNPNGDYFEKLYYDYWEIHFENDPHTNNYWLGMRDYTNVMDYSVSFDQIVLMTRSMEEIADGNTSDAWLYDAGFTKPSGYSHFFIYY